MCFINNEVGRAVGRQGATAEEGRREDGPSWPEEDSIWCNDKGRSIQVLPVRHSLYRRLVHFTVPRQLLK